MGDHEHEGSEDHEDERDDDGGLSIPAPFAPDKDDDSPLGDTDQHSDA